MEIKAKSRGFYIKENSLHWIARVDKSKDLAISSICAQCSLDSFCYGETDDQKGTKIARVNLEQTQNLEKDTVMGALCGAGIEIINRSPHI